MRKRQQAEAYSEPTMTLEEYRRRDAAGTLPRQAMSTSRSSQDKLSSAAIPTVAGVALPEALG